jgi:hypothetical protein
MINWYMKSHHVGKLVSRAYSPNFAAAATMHHSPMMLLPRQHGTTINLAWRLPRQWLQCQQWCSLSPHQKGIANRLIQNPMHSYVGHNPQPTTNPQRPSMCGDLNGRLRLPWCLTLGADAYNSCPECWRIIVCSGLGSGAPWWPWDGSDRQGGWGMVYLALASFYLAKTLVTTHNNQLIRPNYCCTDNNIIAGTGDHDKNQYA